MHTTTDDRTQAAAPSAAAEIVTTGGADAPAVPLLPGAAPAPAPAGRDIAGDDGGPDWGSDSAAPDYLLWYDRRDPDYVIDEPPPPQPQPRTFTEREVAQAVGIAFAIGSAARQAAPPAMVEPMPIPRPYGCAVLLGVVVVFLVSAAVLAAQGNPGGALVALLGALLSVALTPREG